MQGRRMRFCWATGRRAALLCALGVLVSAGRAAAADPPQLAISPSDPTGVTPVTVTATAADTAPNGSTVEVIVRPGGEDCPSEPPPDSNQVVIEPSAPPASSSPFTLEHGSYVVCGWVLDPSPSSPTAVPLTVENSDTLSLELPSSTVLDGATTTLTATGVADVQNPLVYVSRKPAARRRCAANPSTDSGSPLPAFDPATVTFGTFTSSAAVALAGGPLAADALVPGKYLLCAWLMDASASNAIPLAPVASTTVTLTAPTGTLAYSLSGQLLSAGARFPITMSYSTSAADVALYLDIKRLPARGPVCAGSHAADGGAVETITVATPDQRTTSSVRVAAPGVYVTCAWLEWPHGTIDGPFSGRFVVAARHQRATLYYGLTSQRIPRSKLRSTDPIVFQAIDGQIVNLTYYARYTCTRAGRPTTHPIYATSFPAFAQSSAARFGYTFISRGDRAVISGRLGRRSRGTLSESYTSGGYTCHSGTVRFTARRR